MSNKLIIGIDATDWKEEMQRDESPIIKDENDLVSLVVDGKYSTTQAAKIAVCQEEMNIAPIGMLRPRKLQLLTGARQDVNTAIARRMREIETDNGKVFTVREFLGRPGRKSDNDDEQEIPESIGDDPMVTFDSSEGIERALHHLRTSVAGNIWNKFVQIVGANGDVVAAADELKVTIDEMIERLID